MTLVGRGHCGVTDSAGDCSTDSTGSWPLAALDVCIRRCQSCARCNVVSFHSGRGDCSWYAACPRLMWTFGGSKYRTQLVKQTVPPPPPPPPPRWSRPDGSRIGYCALMGPGLGGCHSGNAVQGSWTGVSSPHECRTRCLACPRCRFVSFTLAESVEGRTDTVAQLSHARHHPPYWWRCRWYTRCDLDDLRQTPPHLPQYATVAVRPVGQLSPPAPAASPSSKRNLSVALLGLLELPQARADDELGAPLSRWAAVAQWCQNAERLSDMLRAPHWRVATVVISSYAAPERLQRALQREAGCSAALHILPEDGALRAARFACADKLQELTANPHARVTGDAGFAKLQAFALGEFDVV